MCLIDWCLGYCVSAHKYSHAIDLYTQAIEVNEDNAVYWANRAFAHTKLEEYGSAIQDATKAIEIDPRYSKVREPFLFHLSKGKSLLFVSFSFLLRLVKEWVTKLCFSMQGYYRRGAAYLAMGKFKEALKDFQQVGLLHLLL